MSDFNMVKDVPFSIGKFYTISDLKRRRLPELHHIVVCFGSTFSIGNIPH
jgi:hypothetical protein